MFEQIHKRNNGLFLSTARQNEQQRDSKKQVIGTPKRRPSKPPDLLIICLLLILLLNNPGPVQSKPFRSTIRSEKLHHSESNDLSYSNSTSVMRFAQQSANIFHEVHNFAIVPTVNSGSSNKNTTKSIHKKNTSENSMQQAYQAIANDILEIDDLFAILDEVHPFLHQKTLRQLFKLAAMTGKEQSIDVFLNMLLSPNDNEKGVTPLLLAACYCHDKVAEKLVNNGARADLLFRGNNLINSEEYGPKQRKEKDKTSFNFVPLSRLHIAARYDEASLKHLLLIGDDVNEVIDDKTPLVQALISKNIEAIARLLGARANPDIQNAEGKTILHLAIEHYPASVPLLLQYNATLDTVDNNNQSPLIIALRNKDFVTARLLLEKGAYIDESEIEKLPKGIQSKFSDLLKHYLTQQKEREWNKIKTIFFWLISSVLILIGLPFIWYKYQKYKASQHEFNLYLINTLAELDEFTNDFFKESWSYIGSHTFEVDCKLKPIEDGFPEELVLEKIKACLETVYPNKTIRAANKIKIIALKFNKLDKIEAFKKQIRKIISENLVSNRVSKLRSEINAILESCNLITSNWQEYQKGNLEIASHFTLSDSPEKEVKEECEMILLSLQSGITNLNLPELIKSVENLKDKFKKAQTLLTQRKERLEILKLDLQKKKDRELNYSRKSKLKLKPSAPREASLTPRPAPSKEESAEIPDTESSPEIHPNEDQTRIEPNSQEQIFTPVRIIDQRHLNMEAILITPPRSTKSPWETAKIFFTHKNYLKKLDGTVDENILAARYYLSKLNKSLSKFDQNPLEIGCSLIYSVIRFCSAIQTITLLIGEGSKFANNFARLRNQIVHRVILMAYNEENFNILKSDCTQTVGNLLNVFNAICEQRKYLEDNFFTYLENTIMNSGLDKLGILEIQVAINTPNPDKVIHEIQQMIFNIQSKVNTLPSNHPGNYDQLAYMKLLILRAAEFINPLDLEALQNLCNTLPIIPWLSKSEPKKMIGFAHACCNIRNRICHRLIVNRHNNSFTDMREPLFRHFISFIANLSSPLTDRKSNLSP